MKKIKTFLKLPMSIKFLCAEACAFSAYYHFLIFHRPFASYSRKIGVLGYETPVEESNTVLIKEIQKAVEAVCKYTLWESSCFVRALTAKRMLRRRGLKSTLYMGVWQQTGETFKAHAWLRCGEIYVTGGKISSKYTVTAIFGDQ